MYRIEVSGIPPSFNEFYSGAHWGKRKGMRDEWHGIFMAAIVQSGMPKPIRTPICLNVTEFCKGRVRDCDNVVVAAKFMADTLKELGYIKDDSPKEIASVILQARKGDKDRTVVVIQ